MAFLTSNEKKAIREQIAHTESRTRGEIITVVAKQSDDYRYIPILWAAVIALSVPAWYFLYQTFAQSDWQYPGEANTSWQILYPIQVLVFFAVGMLFQYTPIRMLLIPESIKLRRARRHAHEQYFIQNLHGSTHNCGILIFVSVAEHYVEIIVEKGISEGVDNAVWQSTVDEFVTLVRQGEIGKGFQNAIEHCREILWQHFPADNEKTNEFTNHLIEV